MIKIRKDVFCAMSRNADLRNWLKENMLSMSEYLESRLKKSSGCRENKKIMMSIYNSIYKSNQPQLISKFEKFIKDRFPYALEHKSKQMLKPKTPTSQVEKIAKYSGGYSELNKHKIFEAYKPHVITLPQKLIIVDKDPIRLKRAIDNFISGKPKSDFIIVEDRAYIEYIPVGMPLDIPDSQWEIKSYKAKGLS